MFCCLVVMIILSKVPINRFYTKFYCENLISVSNYPRYGFTFYSRCNYSKTLSFEGMLIPSYQKLIS